MHVPSMQSLDLEEATMGKEYSSVRITINNITLEVDHGSTVLDATKQAGINIPTLCHLNLHDLDAINQSANCRVCLVENETRGNLVPSCAEIVQDGMRIQTDTKKAVQGRRTSMELLLSNHPKECLTCVKNLDCDLQELSNTMNIKDIPYQGEMMNHPIDDSSGAIIKDPNKCVMCRRCMTMCDEVQTVGVLSPLKRGFDVSVGTAFHLDLNETSCTYCGQCVSVCPTAALAEHPHVPNVWRRLNNPNRHTVVQIAPAVRVAIGEMFGYEAGEISTGKLIAALRRLGFDGVFDTKFGADLTIVEEANEFLERLNNDGPLPLLTSCCPAWVNFIEQKYPDLLDIPSSCKSPQSMVGSLSKTYYANTMGIDPQNIRMVAVMPCVAKKAEAARDELAYDEQRDVDYVITTRELGSMIKEAAIDFNNLPDDSFDDILGESTGASSIFGTTGGVVEATARTAYERVTGKTLENVEFETIRGMEGLRKASVTLNGRTINIGIAHELKNARKLLDSIRSGESDLDLIEIMACPGGCIGGGGQPFHHGDINVLNKRREALYTLDKNNVRRKSHENEQVKTLYQKFLGDIGGQKAHKLLHTSYSKKLRI